MATLYSAELAGQYSTPVVKPAAPNGVNSKLRRFTATVTLASQTTSDTIVIGQIPTGMDFCYGVLTSTVSLGTSTVAIGYSGATGAYRTAAAFTAVDTPTLFGNAAQVKAAPLAAEQQIFITIGTASLPSSGTLIVDLYFAGA